ncbi:5-hydroxytryptamine receptor 1E-like [Paramacrobiotus metropolitanus]|uniref:5-hydroxytryptamine receptor 1E-like n=1 Tax=Paramacrobiotus metropolitanus TaxID=2943436 RepID=UPI00244657C5|nr:5-hydroxytryptamine receptor 1E-like [Paramacrobiotus metropolitanus]
MVFDLPFGTIFAAKPNWYPGWQVCAVYLYVLYPLTACQLWAQALITLNRIWAIFHPFSYRMMHTTRMAIFACTFLWAFIHIFGIPLIVTNVTWYRLPGTFYCAINEAAQPVTVHAFEIIMLDVTMCIIYAAYPLLLYKVWSSFRKRSMRVTSSTKMGTFTSRNSQNSSETARLPLQNLKRRHVARRPLVILWLLTISATVCCTPLCIVLLLVSWTAVQPNAFWYNLGSLLYIVQPLLDPVVLIIGLDSLRGALWRNIIRNARD